MKNLAKYTVPELLDLFRNACLAQYDTYLTDNVSKRNKLFDVLLAVASELKRRGVGERRSLLSLIAGRNPQVRLQAAKSVYAVAPVEVKACLEAIAASGLPDQSLSAGMTLSRLEEVPNCLDWNLARIWRLSWNLFQISAKSSNFSALLNLSTAG